jgi:hypothetical protein
MSLVAMLAAVVVPVSTAAGANATSGVFAGYQTVSPLSPFGSASVKFKVTAVQCGSSQTLNFFGSFVGSFYGSGRAAVGVFCPPQGLPKYGGLIGSESTSLVPRPGDVVWTTVIMSKSENEATLNDVTQGLSESASFASLQGPTGPTGAYDGINSWAFCIFGSCGVSSVANFGTLWMYGATLNGVTPAAAGATAVDMQKPPGLPLEVATNALNLRGRAWNEVWENP